MRIIKTFTRIFADDLEGLLPFYESLCQEKAGFRVTYAEMDLELAAVGGFLLIGGSAAALEPFRATVATVLVDTLDDFQTLLVENGATVVEWPKPVPTGRNMRVRHPDGSIVEYVEHTGR